MVAQLNKWGLIESTIIHFGSIEILKVVTKKILLLLLKFLEYLNKCKPWSKHYWELWDKLVVDIISEDKEYSHWMSHGLIISFHENWSHPQMGMHLHYHTRVFKTSLLYCPFIFLHSVHAVKSSIVSHVCLVRSYFSCFLFFLLQILFFFWDHITLLAKCCLSRVFLWHPVLIILSNYFVQRFLNYRICPCEILLKTDCFLFTICSSSIPFCQC
jgi:hypothetical protein